MKNFLKIFVLLEILLFAYIFNSSIYNIYEKNNIAADNLSGYQLLLCLLFCNHATGLPVL